MADKLMVVAHPDDEVIFGGAHLLSEKGWKVVCVTNMGNKQRSREFVKAMRAVGAEYEIWNYRDTYSCHFDRLSLKRDLRKLMARNRYSKVVTHGLDGEYGHPQHKFIARAMRDIVRCNLYSFSVGQKTLPSRLLNQKRKLLEVYMSQKLTIWELCQNNRLGDYIANEHFVRQK